MYFVRWLVILFFLHHFANAEQLQTQYFLEHDIDQTTKGYTFAENSSHLALLSHTPSFSNQTYHSVLSLTLFTLKSGIKLHTTLETFSNTHGAKALFLANDTLLIMAINDRNEQQIALFDMKAKELLSHQEKVDLSSIVRLIAHENGDFSVLANTSSLEQKNSYFARGVDHNSVLIQRFDSRLRLVHSKTFSNSSNIILKQALFSYAKNDYFLLCDTNASKQLYIYNIRRPNSVTVSLTNDFNMTFYTLSEHNKRLYFTTDKGIFFLDQNILVPFESSKFLNKKIKEIRFLPNNNDYAVLEEFETADGNSDASVTLYSARGTAIWQDRLHTPFNDSLDTLYINQEKPFTLIGTYYDDKGAQRLFATFLDNAGKQIRPSVPITTANDFTKLLQKAVVEANIPLTITFEKKRTKITYEHTNRVTVEQKQHDLVLFWNIFFRLLNETRSMDLISTLDFYMKAQRFDHTNEETLLSSLYRYETSMILRSWLNDHLKVPYMATQWPIQTNLNEDHLSLQKNHFEIEWK